ncbi:MAG TPA: GNAT family N-acetyltransferase [Phaeodactylibacter sp.]|nr:GNAT family N-acetyltransferase [Phaeodactylibacter sp.]
MENKLQILSVKPENVDEYGLFCVKSKTNPGYGKKLEWFLKEYPKGLRLKILQEQEGRQIGFIEYTPAERAWRPVVAPGYLFIHCLYVYKKDDRAKGYASMLIEDCMEAARQQGKAGVAVTTSKGPWISTKQVFLKNGFVQTDQRDGFELMHFPLREGPAPYFPDWQSQQENYPGWQLFYAHQCPWHQKCAEELAREAQLQDVPLQLTEITTPSMAQEMPSGFGTFALTKERKLLEYHYISTTRFKNILKKQGRS